MNYHKILNIVLYAIQWDLVFLSYICLHLLISDSQNPRISGLMNPRTLDSLNPTASVSRCRVGHSAVRQVTLPSMFTYYFFLVARSCLILCNLMDCGLPGSSVYGIFQARILQWVAISSSRGSSQPRNRTHDSSVSALAGRFFTTEPPGKPK